jgi:hypothetical protein
LRNLLGRGCRIIFCLTELTGGLLHQRLLFVQQIVQDGKSFILFVFVDRDQSLRGLSLRQNSRFTQVIERLLLFFTGTLNRRNFALGLLFGVVQFFLVGILLGLLLLDNSGLNRLDALHLKRFVVSRRPGNRGPLLP